MTTERETGPLTGVGRRFHAEWHEDWDTLCGPECAVVAVLDAERAARAPEGAPDADLAYVEQAFEQHKKGKLGPTGVSAALVHAIHGMRAARAPEREPEGGWETFIGDEAKIASLRAARAEPGRDIERLRRIAAAAQGCIDEIDGPRAFRGWPDTPAVKRLRAALEAHGEPQPGERT